MYKKHLRSTSRQFTFLIGATKYLYASMYAHAFTNLAAPVKKLSCLYEIG